jgi:hypothetical protein
MRPKNIQVELTVEEIEALGGAILLAKQAAFGYPLDKMAEQIVNERNVELISVGVKLGNVLRAVKMGDVGI